MPSRFGYKIEIALIMAIFIAGFGIAVYQNGATQTLAQTADIAWGATR
jgi:hypothetical protein